MSAMTKKTNQWKQFPKSTSIFWIFPFLMFQTKNKIFSDRNLIFFILSDRIPFYIELLFYRALRSYFLLEIIINEEVRFPYKFGRIIQTVTALFRFKLLPQLNLWKGCVEFFSRICFVADDKKVEVKPE